MVFFFAYNWNELGRGYKFLILQALLVVTFVLYFFKSHNQVLAQALLFAGAVIVGALLALFGQTYQTGADPWQLFATWALLILPMVVFAKSEVMWVFLALLLNTALILYLQVNHSLFSLVFSNRQIPWLYFLTNGVLLLLIEWLVKSDAPRLLSLNYRWAAQVLGLVVLAALTFIGMELIWGGSAHKAINLLIYLVAMPGFFMVYRFIIKDLLLLTGWSFALIVFILSVLAELLFQHLDAGGMLMMALTLIGLTTAAVSFIKKTHQIFKQEQANE